MRFAQSHFPVLVRAHVLMQFFFMTLSVNGPHRQLISRSSQSASQSDRVKHRWHSHGKRKLFAESTSRIASHNISVYWIHLISFALYYNVASIIFVCAKNRTDTKSTNLSIGDWIGESIKWLKKKQNKETQLNALTQTSIFPDWVKSYRK